MPVLKCRCLVAILLGMAMGGAKAQTIDTIFFGQSTSEIDHSLTTYFPPPTDTTQVPWTKDTPPPSDPSATPPSETSIEGLGQSARRLLPRTPDGDVYGGQMTFSMTVDPVKQNYFSIKLWGSDANGGNLILNCNGREIGGRHGTGGLSEDPLYFAGAGWFPERFIYRTEPLPLAMTYHKTSVSITIRSLGSMFDYAPLFSYVPEYQHIMQSPSPFIYAGYTHAGATVDVSGETQGTPPEIQTPRTLENDEDGIARAKSNVNDRLAHLLSTPGAALTQGDAYFLARCYDAKTKAGAAWIEYPSGKSDADLGNQIVAALDALVAKYAAKTEVATDGWGGALGDMGNAIRLSWPVISSTMPVQVDFGGILGSMTRKSGWSSALRASLDSGRFKRQNIANQALFNATNIYLANRGLLLVDPANALKEQEALRYIKEACGILPWLGDDQPGDGPVPTYGTAPYGPNWFMCTTKGTSKDGNGFVGSDYGEIGSWIYKLGLWTRDAQIQARGILMTRSRDIFRFPGTDEKGYLIMQGTDPIGVRNNDLPGHNVYLGLSFSDDFLMASQGASVIGKDLLGYFQEGMNDGQMARNIMDDPYLPDEYMAIKAMPPTNIKLPMAIGQPDFAWVDEENMVVAAKHGEERFFANLYWRQPGFINGVAKVFHLTPTIAHLGDVMVDDIRFRSSGQFKITESGIDWFATPPDKPQAAFGGLPALVALRSDLDAIPPQNRDGGRGTGYTFRYGNWLVAINADYKDTYSLSLPVGVDAATDLISGTIKKGGVVLAPKTSAVFYLPSTATATTIPSRTLYIAAGGGNGFATILWSSAGGASSYNVLRSAKSGGPYSQVATGVTDCTFTDKTAANGQNYYYVVVSVNASGTSSFSPEATARPVAPQTPALAGPWGDVDIDSTGGSSTVSPQLINVTSGSGTIGGVSDACHFLYQTLVGDGIVTAQVQEQSSKNSTARAGIMIRSSMEADDTAVFVLVPEVGTGSAFNYREKKGAASLNRTSDAPLSRPSWVRLKRSGDVITGFASPDGKTWTLIGTGTLPNLPSVLYAGLVAAPGNYERGQTNAASFADVTMQLSASVLPLAPVALSAVGGDTSASLTWAGDVGAATYNVKRATSPSGSFVTVASGVTDSTFTDYGLKNGTAYFYAVSSVNALGESANSSVASLQPAEIPSGVNDLTANATHAQVTLSWSALPGATNYVIQRAAGPAAPYSVIAHSVTTPTYTDTGLKDNTLYYYQVSAVNGAGEGVKSTIGALPPGSMPDEWQSKDIGTTQPGGTSYTDEKFTLIGGGSDIGGTSDSFRYVYQGIKGDFRVTARVNEMQNTSAWAKAGVMIRNSLDANSAYAGIYVTPGNGVSSQYRNTVAGKTVVQTTTPVLTAPYGVRIERQGLTCNFFSSPDGSDWTPMGTITIPMSEKVYVGIVACSQKANTLNHAIIDHVSVQQEKTSP